MTESSLYLAASVALSATTTSLLAWLIAEATFRYHRRHEDRAALDLAVIVSLFVASFGLTVSAVSTLIEDDIAGSVGRGIARVALLMVALVYVGYAWDHRKP